MTQQVQRRNAQMVGLLRQDFQHRREPNYAWSRAVSMYQALPGLRAFWPMSANMQTGGVITMGEISGFNSWLQNVNGPQFGYDSLVPYIEYDGVNQYSFRIDGGVLAWADITGTEAYIAQPGLTLGGWFYFNNAIGTAEGMVSKWGAVGFRSYRLRRLSTGFMQATIQGAGLASVQSTVIPAQSTWFFCAMRFRPGNFVDVFINGSQWNGATAEAAINDSTTAFNIGAVNAAQFMDGRASMCFLCAAQLSDTIILSLYEQTRAMYGV